MHLPTNPGAVEIVTCASGLSDLSRRQCWGADQTPRSVCVGSDADCSFAYVQSGTIYAQALATPSIAPPRDTAITLTGTGFGADNTVTLGGQPCAVDAARTSSAQLVCVPPQLPPGTHPVVVYTASGEMAVMGDEGSGLALEVQTVVTAVAETDTGSLAPVGSMHGGLRLKLTADVSGAGAGFAPATADNAVFIGPIPCPVTAVTAAELECRTGAAAGVVVASYYPLEWGLTDFADLSTVAAGLVTAEASLSLNWGSGSPINQVDYFAGLLSTYVYLDQEGEYLFRFDCDDLCSVTFDGALQYRTGDKAAGSNQFSYTTPMPAFVRVDVQYQERTGLASMRARWQTPAGTALADIPPTHLTAVAPGWPTAVYVTSGGASAAFDVAAQAFPSALAAETDAWNARAHARRLAQSAAGATAAAVYSATETPDVAAVLAGTFTADQLADPAQVQAAARAGGLGSATDVVVLVGRGLSVPGDCANCAVTVTVGGKPCALDAASSSDTQLVCAPPPLPAGVFAVTVDVAGEGLANATSISTQLVVTSISPNHGSLYGVWVTLTGFGFPDSNSAGDAAVTFGAVPCAVDPWTVTFTQLKCYLGPQSGRVSAAPATVAISNAAGSTALHATSGAAMFTWDGPHTPVIASHPDSPLTLTSSSPTTMKVVLTPPPAVTDPSTILTSSNYGVVFVEATDSGRAALWSTQAPFEASGVSIASETVGGQEQYVLSFTYPALPAGSFDLRVSYAPIGLSNALAVTVPLSVTSVGPSLAGSLAGGNEIVETGTGWIAGDVSAVAVMLNPVATSTPTSTPTTPTATGSASTPTPTAAPGAASTPAPTPSPFACAVTAVTETTITCTTDPAESFGDYTVSLRTSALGAFQAVEVAGQGAVYSVTDSATPRLTSIEPSRGSSEGGTLVTLTGSGISGADAVLIGDTPCTDIQPGDTDGVVTCVTGDPRPKPRGKLTVQVHVPGQGLALTDPSSQVAFEYVDLWSRPSTWGGQDPPKEGDSVFIPQGYNVLLDVSTPVLGAVLLQGNLTFDPTAAELSLDATHVLLNGGNLTIGTEDEPFLGRATVTMHGTPDSQELPDYGAKSIAVRSGTLSLVGAPKTPTWTRLIETARPGQSYLVVDGAVGWDADDMVVVASSSVLPYEYDECTVASVTVVADDPSGPYSRVELQAPLQFTHLGIVVDAATGEALSPTPRGYFGHNGSQLDMRAEVGNFTRNVVVQGDEDSARTLYGAVITIHSHYNFGDMLAHAANPAEWEQRYGIHGRYNVVVDGMPKSNVVIKGVEVRNAGQAFRLGRYPIHFHLQGDTLSFIEDNAIHHTYNRAVTVHGTHGVYVSNNVAFNVMGHTYFLEDGVEVSNTFGEAHCRLH